MTAIICTAASAPPALADIGVTTAARMVDGSDTILVARLGHEGGQPVALPERVLKGEAPGGALTLVDPSEGRFLAFNLDTLVHEAGDAPAVVLGVRKGGTLTLKWLNAAIWPQGYRPSTHPSDTVERNAAFVERLLGLSRLARTPDALVQALFADIAGRGEAPPHAALAYLEVAVEHDFEPARQAQIRALGAAAAAGNPNLDPAAMEELATLAPSLPVSIAAPLLLDLAARAPAETAKILTNAVWPMLSARGATVGHETARRDLERALATVLPGLRRAEATRALAVYDSGVAPLQGSLGDAILRAMLDRTPERSLDGLDAAARKALWSDEIATLR